MLGETALWSPRSGFPLLFLVYYSYDHMYWLGVTLRLRAQRNPQLVHMIVTESPLFIAQ